MKKKEDVLINELTGLVRGYVEEDAVLCAVKDEISSSEYVAHVYRAGFSRESLVTGNAFLLRQLVDLQVLIDTDNKFLIDSMRIILNAVDFEDIANKYLDKPV